MPLATSQDQLPQETRAEYVTWQWWSVSRGGLCATQARGAGTRRSPRHRMPGNSRNEGQVCDAAVVECATCVLTVMEFAVPMNDLTDIKLNAPLRTLDKLVMKPPPFSGGVCDCVTWQ